MWSRRVDGASDRPACRRYTRRAFLAYGVVPVGVVSLLAACTPAPPAAPPATQAPLAVQPTQAPIVTPAPASAAAKPTEAAAKPAAGAQATTAPAPTTAPAAPARGEAKGKLTYAWHTTISPAWFDPQENPPQITPYFFGYALHDALVKHLPGKTFAPSLAESYEIAPDSKSATFKLRQGIKFHDGTPITPDDVKFTFEKYRGANAGVLHDKTQAIESPDSRTIRFVFKEPFLDFLTIYGSPSSGAGWVVPKAYYEKVGKDGFKTAPIGAGPYRFVKQQAGAEVELEAFTDYWRKTPSIKTLLIRGVPEGSTRVAQLKTGEVDVINQIPGDLLDIIRADSTLHLVPVKAGTAWLEPMSFDAPDSPFTDVRVRQALSLAIDRKAVSDAEMGGLGFLDGNWIPSDWPGAIERPMPEFSVNKAKQLLSEAGYANGFEVSKLTPLGGYDSWAERLVGQLRAVGIKTQVNSMERGAFYEALAPGDKRLKGLVLQLSGAPGDAAGRIRENALCKGTFSGLCIPDIETRMQKYDSSSDLQERKKLLDEVQNLLLDQYLIIPVLRQAFINAVGPRIANDVNDVMGAIPQYVYMGPWEDVALKD